MPSTYPRVKSDGEASVRRCGSVSSFLRLGSPPFHPFGVAQLPRAALPVARHCRSSCHCQTAPRIPDAGASADPHCRSRRIPCSRRCLAPARPSCPPHRWSICGSPSPDWASSQYSGRSVILLRSKPTHLTLQLCHLTLFIRGGRHGHLTPLVTDLLRSSEGLDVVVIRADSPGSKIFGKDSMFSSPVSWCLLLTI
ncbi:uncharacterized protein LOC120710337 [Panicum virgatum]|uniref:DUF569 domain-containing protein n=1 Tax=Panicum virgatum TaxID=38727 RepID=A0A8T0T2F3_PANVG|nr:uncharacterized protein LOC120710337 [Panicum virgatum]KAG2603445.1 hypothetical protein PVAP13_5KG772250 [Panicum virgatum]